jgi:hypothetical protein
MIIEFNAEIIVRAITLLSATDRQWFMQHPSPQNFAIEQHEFFVEMINNLQRALTSANLAISAKEAAELNKAFESATTKPNGEKVLETKSLALAQEHLRRLLTLVSAELGIKKFLSLSPKALEIYEPKVPLMGDEVSRVFVDAAYDIAEAGKCLALDRSTAAVFHAMRAMEIAVGVFGINFGVTVSSSNGEPLAWGVVVANIKDKIDVMPSGPRKDELLKISTMLYHVNRAFRTKTAHPSQIYTQEEAENIFNACKAFMHELAVECN